MKKEKGDGNWQREIHKLKHLEVVSAADWKLEKQYRN